MDHAGNISFCLSLDRKTVAAITHGYDCILQVGSCGGIVHDRSKLCMNAVIHSTDGFADFEKSRACVISNFILG